MKVDQLQWAETSTGFDLKTPRGKVGYVVMVDDRPNWFGYVWASSGDYSTDPGYRFVDANLDVDVLKQAVMVRVTIEQEGGI